MAALVRSFIERPDCLLGVFSVFLRLEFGRAEKTEAPLLIKSNSVGALLSAKSAVD